MEPAAVVEAVADGLTHDAERSLQRLLGGVAGTDHEVEAAAIFLRILTCRFDEALNAAHVLRGGASQEVPLVRAAVDLAVAVCAGQVAAEPPGVAVDGPYRDLVAVLEVEAAMSSGLIGRAAEIATCLVGEGEVESALGAWSVIALARAMSFEGRFVDADRLIARLERSPALAGWPQMKLLTTGTRIFVDGNLGRLGAVQRGLDALLVSVPEVSEHDYVNAGAHVLAAFGLSAVGRLEDATEIMLRGGGGPHLPRLQIVDRLYGYEMLVEEALSRDDLDAARDWSEHAAVLPIDGHSMASAALGRIKARMAIADHDPDAGMRESADSGALAALVGGDLEVIRARVIEASARAASGDRARGIEELEEVARRAGATSASAVKDWAVRELRTHGRRLRNVPGIGWDTLTPTQQGIARLAATGLRNREIASALWVSEKTVESHVAVVLNVLGATNRVGIGRELSGEEVDPVFGSGLTTRQREVALLVAEGASNAGIAAGLGISDKTVEKHISALFDRLGVRTRGAIAVQVRGGRHTYPHEDGATPGEPGGCGGSLSP